jgi:antitoxin component YwqK of YwqJK toxin-antitoxin module
MIEGMGFIIENIMEDEVEIKTGFDGITRYKYTYLNNIQHGIQQWLNSNNFVKEEFYCNKGVMHGINKYFYFDGTRDGIKTIKLSLIHGIRVTFKYKRK